jgi:hypothetical protein
LRIAVKNGELTISVGVETLAWAFERLPENQPYNEQRGETDDDSPEFLQSLLITNPGGFAVDVKRAMKNEEEDGATELFKFLDNMCQAAVDDGSQFVDEPKGMQADQREFKERAKEWRRAKSAAQTQGGNEGRP